MLQTPIDGIRHMEVPFYFKNERKIMSQSFQIEGTIDEIKDEEIISENFKKRVLVLLHNPNPEYPDYITFEFTQQKTSVLDLYKKGDKVSISFNIKGRRDNSGRGWNTLQGYQIEKKTPQKEEPAGW